MWSLTSPLAGRASGAKKIRSPTRRDLFNSIGHKRTSREVPNDVFLLPHKSGLTSIGCHAHNLLSEGLMHVPTTQEL